MTRQTIYSTIANMQNDYGHAGRVCAENERLPLHGGRRLHAVLQAERGRGAGGVSFARDAVGVSQDAAEEEGAVGVSEDHRANGAGAVIRCGDGGGGVFDHAIGASGLLSSEAFRDVLPGGVAAARSWCWITRRCTAKGRMCRSCVGCGRCT